MKLVLTVFIDGLKPESVEHMPFLNSFKNKRRIRTELGYSLTCYASMFSGVYPDRHLHWFSWKYSPHTSPFRWLDRYKINKFPHVNLTRWICYRFTRFLNRDNTSNLGMPLPWYYIPMKNWHYFDITEKKFWGEPNYLENYLSIFDILRVIGIPFEVVGAGKKHFKEPLKAIERYNCEELKPWTFFFIGEIDFLSHHYGQDATQTRQKLKDIDHILKQKYQLFEKRCPDFYFMVFSDHGHMKVKEKIQLKDFFRFHGDSLDNYIYFIDANFVRFWFRSERERKRVFYIMQRMGDKGYFLTEDYFERYNVNMPDNRYGDAIFYLDAPRVFEAGVVVAGKKIVGNLVSYHGHAPEHPDTNAAFISNKKIKDYPYVKLVDIMPSILDALELEIPRYVDGKSLWDE